MSITPASSSKSSLSSGSLKRTSSSETKSYPNHVKGRPINGTTLSYQALMGTADKQPVITLDDKVGARIVAASHQENNNVLNVSELGLAVLLSKKEADLWIPCSSLFGKTFSSSQNPTFIIDLDGKPIKMRESTFNSRKTDVDGQVWIRMKAEDGQVIDQNSTYTGERKVIHDLLKKSGHGNKHITDGQKETYETQLKYFLEREKLVEIHRRFDGNTADKTLNSFAKKFSVSFLDRMLRRGIDSTGKGSSSLDTAKGSDDYLPRNFEEAQKTFEVEEEEFKLIFKTDSTNLIKQEAENTNKEIVPPLLLNTSDSELEGTKKQGALVGSSVATARSSAEVALHSSRTEHRQDELIGRHIAIEALKANENQLFNLKRQQDSNPIIYSEEVTRTSEQNLEILLKATEGKTEKDCIDDLIRLAKGKALIAAMKLNIAEMKYALSFEKFSSDLEEKLTDVKKKKKEAEFMAQLSVLKVNELEELKNIENVNEPIDEAEFMAQLSVLKVNEPIDDEISYTGFQNQDSLNEQNMNKYEVKKRMRWNFEFRPQLQSFIDWANGEGQPIVYEHTGIESAKDDVKNPVNRVKEIVKAIFEGAYKKMSELGIRLTSASEKLTKLKESVLSDSPTTNLVEAEAEVLLCRKKDNEAKDLSTKLEALKEEIKAKMCRHDYDGMGEKFSEFCEKLKFISNK